jgi:hypothetical protein
LLVGAARGAAHRARNRLGALTTPAGENDHTARSCLGNLRCGFAEATWAGSGDGPIPVIRAALPSHGRGSPLLGRVSTRIARHSGVASSSPRTPPKPSPPTERKASEETPATRSSSVPREGGEGAPPEALPAVPKASDEDAERPRFEPPPEEVRESAKEDPHRRIAKHSRRH